MLEKYWFYVIGILSLIAITSALIAEYYFNLEPCKMCLKQREPYYAIIATFIVFAFLRLQKKIWFFLGLQIISAYGIFYSVWHVGIENKMISGPSGCSQELNITTDISNLKEQILSKAVTNCEDVTWTIFGVSAATINSLLFFLIFLINAIYLFNNYASKKKKND